VGNWVSAMMKCRRSLTTRSHVRTLPERRTAERLDGIIQCHENGSTVSATCKVRKGVSLECAANPEREEAARIASVYGAAFMQSWFGPMKGPSSRMDNCKVPGYVDG
jgi:predicted TIM-barrel enzyme